MDWRDEKGCDEWRKIARDPGWETYRREISGRVFEVTQMQGWDGWAVDYGCPLDAHYPWRVLGRPHFATKENAFREAELIAKG